LVQIKAFFKVGKIYTSFSFLPLWRPAALLQAGATFGAKQVLRDKNKFCPYKTSKRGIIYYTVGSTKDLIKYILPHFDKYPLATAKLKYYLVFKKIILLMEK
jgi:hypothetical protein